MAEEGRSQGGQIAAMIQQIAQQEKAVQLENKRLTQLMSIQDALIQKQRGILADVAKTAQELREVEEKRAKLRAALTMQKTQLLVGASESQDASTLIEETLMQSESDTPISTGTSGKATLKAIDAIQAKMMALTQECLQGQDLSIPSDQLQQFIGDVSDLLQKLVDGGLVTESPEDTIRRQSYIIASMVPNDDPDAAA